MVLNILNKFQYWQSPEITQMRDTWKETQARNNGFDVIIDLIRKTCYMTEYHGKK